MSKNNVYHPYNGRLENVTDGIYNKVLSKRCW